MLELLTMATLMEDAFSTFQDAPLITALLLFELKSLAVLPCPSLKRQ